MNMKQIILTTLLALVALMGQAQEIGSAQATAEDYINLLNKQGYYVYALDLSKLEKDRYLMSPVIQVYSNTKLEQDLMEDFWISYTNSAPIITVGLMPQNDSLFTCNFQFDKVCGLKMNLPKSSVKNEADGSEEVSFLARPFIIYPDWKENEVIPIVAYSSSWYDPDIQSCRNCDVNEFDKDYLTTATFQNSPKIYVFGIKIRKQ